MKKFLTMVLMLAMVMSMTMMVSAADATFPYTAGDDGDNWLIFHVADLEAYADDVEITITIKMVDDTKADPGYAWCVNNSADSEWQWWSGHSVADTQTAWSADKVNGTTDTIVITVGTLRAYAEGGDGAVLNCWNGIIPVGVTAATEAGDATPVVAVAMVAMVSCAAFVVLRKKEA